MLKLLRMIAPSTPPAPDLVAPYLRSWSWSCCCGGTGSGPLTACTRCGERPWLETVPGGMLRTVWPGLVRMREEDERRRRRSEAHVARMAEIVAINPGAYR